MTTTALKLFAAALLSIALHKGVAAETPATDSDIPSHYAPYALLAGDWDVTPATGGPAVARQQVTFGPGNSYLWFALSVFANGREEPHLEGILVWNALNDNLDMLFSVDLNGGKVQEQGTLSIKDDGTLVREINAVYPGPNGAGGKTSRFRQTFSPVSSDRILTSVMRETPEGWVPTFPGSDALVLTRRAGS